MKNRTTFECRCCGNYTQGNTDGTTDQPGWMMIARIDGPNHACPECSSDPSNLDGLREDGYESAHFVSI